MSDHARRTGPMRASPRCDARTRGGARCRAPAATGRTRCRMHGGANRSGAPAGNTNATCHGRFARQTHQDHADVAALLAEVHDLLAQLP